ncbi:phosphatase PAP2 family protein [Methylobacterium platani]|uniref:Inositolphosphotransferase Aur1/Ipt1 domain-containing protein n=1 Tax=Methylobacterium platani TaxID=427683 RepID=A0A179SID5_9HYPH|nr:phosphatase PAP2 family protein [Methylobacterium platani]OAS26701.1 hypothetical protein A5481_04430 [Methylobacterium platani]
MSNLIALSGLPARGPLVLRRGPGAASRLGWIVLGTAGLGLLAAASVGGFRIADHVLIALMQLVALGGCGAAIRARGWVRVGTAADIAAQLLLAGLLAPLLSVVAASTNLPYRDEDLLALDAALFGFDWGHVVALAQTRSLLMEVLSHVYASLMQQLVILFALLLAAGRTARAQAFCLAWILTLAATIAIFPLVPALGGYLHHGVAQDDTHVLVSAAWRHVDILGPARDGTLSALTGESLGGIVTFPSFHAAAAALLAWGFWGLPVLRWPALALNLAMLAATPVIGGHYLVDVVAGLVLAGLALGFVRLLTRMPAAP